MLISSIKSCGKRIPFVVDRLFLKPVAISFPFGWCRNTIQENKQNKIVDVYVHLNVRCMCTLIVCKAKMAKPESATNTCRASIHNVTEDYTMALSHSTQTRPEKTYLWRFLALNRSDMSAKPCRISVEAPTEHDARRVLAPYFILSLAAHLPAQGVCNA
ncbi:host cell division inhibitor Icd-like protein [Erwinia sp. V90_4]|uniref:host cell division inhibitor Icd-like protein n=1 Tax=Erwinia sp. V90_4 TaxID=3044239 RepID=UPI0032B7AAC0